jgi:glycerophosphoryl diester phosphodiesterase
MSSDNFLVGFRNDLDNHANISELFPGFENAGVNHYTLEELKSMDVGSSYNNSTYNRSGYIGLQILTLEEIINICEGKLPDGTPDPADNGNRPGIYLRIYQPWLNVGMEEVLKSELTRLGWYDDDLNNLRVIPTFPDKVAVANTKGRVFLGTLEKNSLLKLEDVFQGKIPLAFWLWKSSNYIKVDDAETYAAFVNYGVNHGAQFISPNTSTNDLLKVWQSNLTRRTNARIQGFTIDTKASLSQYTYNIQPESEGNIYQLEFNLTDGVITNRPQYATFYYGVNILPESDRIVPAPEFLDSGEIRDVFLNLGYQN